ncbi:allergin-1 isoform X2 [Mirounga leonina]|uniref:allergin-1 isoform X2 n=2 Tax=Mirounga TaxID=9714 RepID=UPI00156BF1FE|nr:allergin-1 isoform X2 [Mirounga leonina]
MTHPHGGTTPSFPSYLISSERMWRQLNKLFFWGIFSSLTLQKAALDCDTRRINKLLSPSLDSETKVVMRGQNVSLICSNQNKSLQITYFLFWREKHLRTHDGKSEPMIFNLSISEAHELGPYKCKAQVSNCSVVKYSREFNFVFVGGDGCPFCLQLLLPGLLLVLIVIILVLAFWILPKYKARKAMRDKAPRDYGNTAREVRIYANICENQAGEESARGLEPRQCVPTAQDGTGCSQGILYATPVFQKAAPRVHEACNDCKTGYIYSELIF